jgi:hypothetical protein
MNDVDTSPAFIAVTRRLAWNFHPERMRALPLTLPEQTWNASEMRRRDWIAAERAFNRREPLSKECDMGRGRWSKWSVGGDERHTLEFGFAYRFDIRAGPKSNGLQPDFWYASAREGSLGEFPTFEAAAQACEDEARRLIEEALQRGDDGYDMKLIDEQWTLYLALPHRLRSRKTRTRYK